MNELQLLHYNNCILRSLVNDLEKLGTARDRLDWLSEVYDYEFTYPSTDGVVRKTAVRYFAKYLLATCIDPLLRQELHHEVQHSLTSQRPVAAQGRLAGATS